MSLKNQIEEYKTQRNMDRYGVAWFKFDEPSGNVYDKLGNNYVGTVYSNATRVEGWNGKGYAMNFDRTSTSYINFNNRVIPTGNITIRFKLKLHTKPTSENQEIISNSYATATEAGIRIWVNTAGSITFTCTRKSSGKYSFYIDKPALYDNEWHDYMLSWNADENIAELYEDGKFISKTNSVGKNSLTPTYNLRIGGQPHSAEKRYFNGQLDELEIYNKALIADDFIVNKVLIKTDTEYLYLGQNGDWETLGNEPTVQDFLDFGIDELTDEQLQEFESKYGKQYRIYRWTDSDAAISVKLKAKPQPKPQLVYPRGDISISGVENIDKLELIASGDVRTAISFDSGITWNAHNGTEWVVVDDASNGMDVATFNALTPEQLNEIRNESNFVRFSYCLADENAWTDNLRMVVSMIGYEQPASNNDWTFTYDQLTKTITYNIKKDGTFTVKYIDA